MSRFERDNHKLCGADCRYRSLYEGTQLTLSSMGERQAEALGRVGRLRADIVKVLRHLNPTGFVEAERRAGKRLSDVDDGLLTGYLHGFVADSLASAPSGLDDLRNALESTGITLPAGNDPTAWAAAVRQHQIARNTAVDATGRAATLRAPATGERATGTPHTPRTLSNTPTPAVNVATSGVADLADLFDRPGRTIPDSGHSADKSNSATGTTSQTSEPAATIDDLAELFAGDDPAATGGDLADLFDDPFDPPGENTSNPLVDTSDNSIDIFNDDVLDSTGAGFEPEDVFEPEPEPDTEPEPDDPRNDDTPQLEQLERAAPAAASTTPSADTSSTAGARVGEPADTNSEDVSDAQTRTKRATNAPVRPQTMPLPGQTPHQLGRRRTGRKTSPLHTDTATLAVVGDEINDALLAATSVPRPVFIDDLRAVVRDEDKLQTWEAAMRADAKAPVRFIPAKGRYRHLGSLVVPRDEIRAALAEFQHSLWGDCIDRYRGAKVYELGVLLRTNTSNVVGAWELGEHTVVFRLADGRGMIGVTCFLGADIHNGDAAAQLMASIETLLNERLTMLAVLVTNTDAVAAVRDVVTEQATIRHWSPTMPVALARSSDFATNRAGAELLLGG